jgi:acetate kinase
MIILVINAGSSSLKYQLFNMAGAIVMARGSIERIGETKGVLTHHICMPGQGKKNCQRTESKRP